MHTSVDQARVKVHIGVQLSSDKVGILKGSPFKGNCNLYQRFLATDLKDLIGYALDNACTRVIVTVDAMSKAHQSAFLALDLGDEHCNVVRSANLLEHPQHRLICSPVQWSIQGYNLQDGQVPAAAPAVAE